MNIFEEEFSTGRVVEAASASNATLQTWLRRDLIVGHRGKAPIGGGGTPGAHRKFSFYNVMEIAVGKGLIDVGAPSVEAAFQAASDFAHTGTTPSGWAGDPAAPYPREPGMPFNPYWKVCKTLLCVAGQRSEVFAWDGKGDLWSMARAELGFPEGMILLEIDGIYERVVRALGHDPWGVLRFCYRSSAPEATVGE